MPTTLADLTDATDVAVQLYTEKTAKKGIDNKWQEIYATENSVTDLETKESSQSGLDFAGRVVEQAAFTEKSPIQNFDKTWTQAQYGVVLTFSKMMWLFGIKRRKLESSVNSVITAVSNLRNKRLYEKLTNSFSTAYTAEDISGNYSIDISGGDSKALISNAHTREDAGVDNDNRITDGTTVNMQLDYDGIKAAHRTAQAVLDPVGIPLDIDLDTIVVSKNSTNHQKAMELKGSIDSGKISESFDNDGSGVRTFNIHATRWFLKNTGFWFMMDSKMKNSDMGALWMRQAQEIMMDPVNIVYKTKELQWTCEWIGDWQHNDFRNWVGSKGTNVA